MRSSHFTNPQLGKSAKFLNMDNQKNTLKTIQEILTQPSNISAWTGWFATVREALRLLKCVILAQPQFQGVSAGLLLPEGKLLLSNIFLLHKGEQQILQNPM